MKKVLSIIVVLCSLLTFCCGIAMAEDLSLTMQIDAPMMQVNGVEKAIDPGRDTTPVIVEGRTLVPIRAIVEEIGGTVAWSEETQTTTLTYGERAIRLTVDDTTAYVGEDVFALDVAPTIIGGRTMLPIRFIAERFDLAVTWDEATKQITIETAANETPTTTPTEETNDPQAVVVYFSATGNTEALAQKVADAAHADMCEIVPTVAYTSADLNYNNDDSRANREMNNNIRPEIEALSVDIAQYDVIVLGYPIWWGTCPAAVETFLADNDLSGKTIMPFCTSGSSSISGSLPTIRHLAPNSTVTDGFRGTSATTIEEISTWLANNGWQAK